MVVEAIVAMETVGHDMASPLAPHSRHLFGAVLLQLKLEEEEIEPMVENPEVIENLGF